MNVWFYLFLLGTRDIPWGIIDLQEHIGLLCSISMYLLLKLVAIGWEKHINIHKDCKPYECENISFRQSQSRKLKPLIPNRIYIMIVIINLMFCTLQAIMDGISISELLMQNSKKNSQMCCMVMYACAAWCLHLLSEKRWKVKAIISHQVVLYINLPKHKWQTLKLRQQPKEPLWQHTAHQTTMAVFVLNHLHGWQAPKT